MRSRIFLLIADFRPLTSFFALRPSIADNNLQKEHK